MARRISHAVHDDPAKLGSKHIDALPGTVKFNSTKKKIIGWFLKNCRDPRKDLSYEVGFVGTYSTHEIIDTLFSKRVSDHIRNSAISEIEARSAGCKYWETEALAEIIIDKSMGSRTVLGSSSGEFQTLHQKMMQEITALEHAMAQFSLLNSQIGHNRPPEPIEPAEFGIREYNEISRAIGTLKSINPETSVNKVFQAAWNLKAIGERLKRYVGEQGDNFISAAIKSAGSETGKWIVRLPIIAIIADKLISVFNATTEWLASIGIIF
jgi:hypothetical protein